MRILVLGSGAREHALVLSLFHDPAVDDIHVAPGNVGMKPLATLHSEVTRIDDPDTVVALARDIAADLVVIGPEIPLVAGVADALRSAGFLVFGPNKAAARIEGSKAFAKDVMAAAGVRTARSEQLTSELSDNEIESALDRFGPHYVVKDDGLAGGKGVVVTDDRTAARAHVDAVLAAGNPVLLESFLTGPEVSLFCLVDGETVVPLIPAQDHKRVGDGDQGPNTGGMGAYCPLPWLPADGVRRIVDEVCVPVNLCGGGVPTPVCCMPGWPGGRTVLRWWNSTAASATPKPRRSWRCLKPRLVRSCTPWRRGRWPTCRRWNGMTSMRSPWCWPPKATQSTPIWVR